MPSEKDNQNMKLDKMPSIIYVDIESLNKQSRKFFNNKNKRAYSLLIFNVKNLRIWAHRIQTYLYRGKDCVKVFCTSLREHDTNAINFKNKKMLLLINKELKLQQGVT